jgi:hypothetical protein
MTADGIWHSTQTGVATLVATLLLIPDECPSVETLNQFYRLGSEIILAALVRHPEVLPTLATCAVVLQLSSSFYLTVINSCNYIHQQSPKVLLTT